MGQEGKMEPDLEIVRGLKKIRRRRWCLWGLILVYVPAIWASLEITGSDRKTAIVFGIWIVLVSIAASVTALSRCPRCQNYFHMNGFIPLYLRRCLHCGLPVGGEGKKSS